jgi:cell division protein FtsZ
MSALVMLELAVSSPLLDVSISGAKGVLFVVAGADDLGIMEVQEAAKVISESVDKNARVIFGIMRDEKLKKGQVRLSLSRLACREHCAHSSHSGPERSLFAMPVERQEEQHGRIYHEIIKREDKKPEEEKEEVKPKHESKKEAPATI